MTDLRLLTVEDVAEVLKVQPSTVRDYVRKGKLEGFRVGRSIRIKEESFRRFLEELQSK